MGAMMWDVLTIGGVLSRYTAAAGSRPLAGWRRVDDAELEALRSAIPPSVTPVDDPVPDPPLIVRSPGGDRWQITIDDSGNLGRKRL